MPGCQSCDECVIDLETTNNDINDTLISIDEMSAVASELQEADTLDLAFVESTVADLSALVNETAKNLTMAANNLDGLNNTRSNLQLGVIELEIMVRE